MCILRRRNNCCFRIPERESGEESHSGRKDAPNARELHEIPRQGELHGIYERPARARGAVYEKFLAANQRKNLSLANIL